MSGTSNSPAPGGASHSRRTLVGTAVLALAVDLSSKMWASRALADKGIDLPGPLDLQLTHNRGVAFSLFADAPPQLVIVVTAAVTIGLAVAAWRGLLAALPAGLILGGASANLADRIAGGGVVDMLHTGWWPTFNLADVLLATGVTLLCIGAGGERPLRRWRADRRQRRVGDTTTA